MAKEGESIEGEAAGGGGKKKLIIMIAAAILLLAGGAGGALFLMGGDDSAGGAEEEVAEEPAPEEGDPIYVNMEPKFVVHLPAGGPAGMMQVAVTVYTRQQEVADFIGANDPLLRHHLNNLFESQSSAELLTLEGKEGLQQSVQELFEKQMKELDQPGDIKGIYFTEFVLQ